MASRRAIALTVSALLGTAALAADDATQATPPKHHSKAKGALVGGAGGALVGGKKGAAVGAAGGALVQHHKNVKDEKAAQQAQPQGQ